MRSSSSSYFVGLPAILVGAAAGPLTGYILDEEHSVVPLTLWMAHPAYYGWWVWSAFGAAFGGVADLTVRLSNTEFRRSAGALFGLLMLFTLLLYLIGFA